MNRPAKMEEHRWKRKLAGLYAAERLTHPLCLAAWILAWGALLRLCLYGNVRKNLPVLALCLLFLLLYLCFFCLGLRRYGKRSPRRICTQFELEENRLRTGAESYELSDLRWYRRKGSQICLFLKKQRFVWLDTEKVSAQKRELLEMKLTQKGILAARFWRIPAALFLVAVTVLGAAGVVWSAVPYHGALAWKLDELRSSRRIRLVHNNLYDDGLDGILEDIRAKVDMPERLCLINGFNLHFRADGTVESLSVFLGGFDENGNLADTYLIDYNAAASDEITVWTGGVGGSGVFEQEKDFGPLLEAMRVLPLRETVEDWQEEVYGILYYGERSWGYSTEGIRYLAPDGTVSYPGAYAAEEIHGYSISVFCPENEMITPVRYLYMGVL